MQDDLGSILSQLSPEQVSQLLGLSTLDEEGSALERQMAQAQALQQPAGRRHTTTLGSAFGAAGDVMRGIRGGLDERSLREKQQGLIGQKRKGRLTLADLFKVRPQEQAPDIEPTNPMGPGASGVPPWMLGMMLGR